AAGRVNLAAAKATSESRSETYHAGVNVGGNVSSNAAFRAAGVGVDGGVDVGHSQTETADVHYTNAALNAGQVSIKAGQDLTLRGAHVSGDTVALQVGGDTNVTSVQDRHHEDTQTWNANASVGAAVGVNQTLDPVFGVIANPTFSLGANGSHGWDDSRTTVKQAGIDARQSLTAEVKGDVNLVGGHLVSQSGVGSVKVGGQVAAIDVVDQHDRDGNSGGGSFGIKSDGLATLTVSYGKDDQVHRTAVQRGTIAIKDLQVGGGIAGRLNRDAGQVASVTDDRKIAGSKMTVEVGDLLEHLKNKVKSRKGDAEAGDGPSGRSRLARQAAPDDEGTPAQRVGKPVPDEHAATSARREQDRYAQRVIVQQGDDAVTAQAAKNLADKHPENTTLVKADQQGNLIGLEQVPAGRGNVKVQVVGHGDVEGGTLGGVDAPALARQVAQVKAKLGEDAQVEKVALVG
ncbi:C80 family cysteine peptidase, partial [Burkholderia ubonensis]|uniref:C80 family cysteine peptidase n=1 Tax=Burkholderia ubonensis TaxID=101571 RepID=UPI0012F96E1B